MPQTNASLLSPQAKSLSHQSLTGKELFKHQEGGAENFWQHPPPPPHPYSQVTHTHTLTLQTVIYVTYVSKG